MTSADEETVRRTWQTSLWFGVLHISPSSKLEGLATSFARQHSSVVQIELSTYGAFKLESCRI